MVAGCIIPGCPTRASDMEVTFHNVPHDPILFEQWNSTIRLDQIGKKLSSMNRVCSIHFAESDFWVSSKGVRFLKRYAVPTVFDMCADPSDESCTKNAHQNKIKTGSKSTRIPPQKKPANKIKNKKEEGMPQKDDRNSTMILSGEVPTVTTCTNKEPLTYTRQKGTKKSTISARKKKLVVLSLTKKEIQPNTPQTPEMLIKNGFHVAEDPRTSVQHPGSIPFLPAPSGPASPEEGSILKEAVISETKGVTPVSCQVQEPHFICAECEEKEVMLKRYKIGPEFSIFLCPTEECIYPLGEDDLYKFLFRNLKNNSLQQCTPTDDAPLLDFIVELLDFFEMSNIIHGFRNQGLKSC